MAKKHTLGEVIDHYVKNVTVDKKGWQQENYRANMVKRHAISSLDIKKIRSNDIVTYKNDRMGLGGGNSGRNISGNTLRIELSFLSSVFKYAINVLSVIDKNPVSYIQKPKVSKGRDRRLTKKEEKLISNFYIKKNKEMYYAFIIALETAMRQGEILGLLWENVDLKKGVAYMPETKNGTERYVPLSKKARLIFAEIPQSLGGKVFRYTSNSFKSRWRKDIKDLGISDLHFHDLRHEAISRLFELGTLNVMEVATISGHKSLASLKRYTHLKAHKLVRKLDIKKRKNDRPDIYFPSFPAQYTESQLGIELQFLDFDDIKVMAQKRDDAYKIASIKLLHKLAYAFQFGLELPSPTKINVSGEEAKDIVMVNPLYDRR
ncbi:site-specific integrase [Klebsiella aerogenes]|uniref:site-specific integrase n=1 Tax=Klebsiella aerogenes TaxID=548 RepID=UPI002FF00F10